MKDETLIKEILNVRTRSHLDELYVFGFPHLCPLHVHPHRHYFTKHLRYFRRCYKVTTHTEHITFHVVSEQWVAQTLLCGENINNKEKMR